MASRCQLRTVRVWVFLAIFFLLLIQICIGVGKSLQNGEAQTKREEELREAANGNTALQSWIKTTDETQPQDSRPEIEGKPDEHQETHPRPIAYHGGSVSCDEKSANCNPDCIPMTVGSAFGGLAVGVIIAIGVYYIKKRQNKQLEDEIKRNKEDWAGAQRLKNQNRELEKQRNELKVLLEKQRNELKLQLEEVKRQKEENKQKLKEVETEIKEKELMFDKPKELLREKEKLLQEQWKLDQTKKDLDKQLLNIEKLVEPLENQIPDTVHWTD